MGFAQAPVDFINALVASQVTCLQCQPICAPLLCTRMIKPYGNELPQSTIKALRSDERRALFSRHTVVVATPTTECASQARDLRILKGANGEQAAIEVGLTSSAYRERWVEDAALRLLAKHNAGGR